MRELILSFHRLFAVLFATDLADEAAGHRAQACAMRSLTLLENMDVKLHPNRKKPMYLAKYNFVGLLRCCEHFRRYRHVGNLYEGGLEGEGIVKILRALTSRGVTPGWPINLLTKYGRTEALNCLMGYLETSSNESTPTSAVVDDQAKIKKY